MELPDTNPKTRFGVRKPGIANIPPIAALTLGQAMTDGAAKYGRTNWREHEVTASVYYDAAARHLMSWWDGEREAQDSGIHHLGHAMACFAILLDAEASGKLIDDRPSVAGTTAEFIARMTKPMEPFGDMGALVPTESASPQCVLGEVWGERERDEPPEWGDLLFSIDRIQELHGDGARSAYVGQIRRRFGHEFMGAWTPAQARAALFYADCAAAGILEDYDLDALDEFLRSKGVEV